MMKIECPNVKENALRFSLYLSLWEPIMGSILFQKNKWHLLYSLIIGVIWFICCYFYSIYRCKKNDTFFANMRPFYVAIMLIEFIALMCTFFINSVFIIPTTFLLLFIVSILLLNKR